MAGMAGLTKLAKVSYASTVWLSANRALVD